MRITVDVKPGSNHEKIEEIGENHLLVYVKAPARKGKANTVLIKILRKHFGVPVSLIMGHTSNRKVFLVEK
ncbi:MAG: DUF167 domain-containing protein [Candidatus Bathyarchaeota archaeon]|nr:DUF167 domain-containing protein [Candidatus Bathyarchaeota archaeon]